MEIVTVAFDVDGTLRKHNVDQNAPPVAREAIRTLLITLSKFENVLIHCWSGGGELYARQVAAALGLTPYIDSYSAKVEDAMGLGVKIQGAGGVQVDIAVDDVPTTDLAPINLIVPKHKAA
jgi:hypothetical protein